MADKRTQSERYAEIGAELIRTEPSLDKIKQSEATICYLSSTAAPVSKGRAKLGECERVPEKWKWAVPADFTVTVFEPNCEGLDDEQLRALVHHELLHVGIGEDKDGNETHSIVGHDIDEFRAVADLYGLDWSERR